MSRITVSVLVNAPIEKVWQFWNEPEHIMKWAFASDDWECPHAENDLRKDGVFKTVMSAKDKSFSFDFVGKYSNIVQYSRIEYAMPDGREVSIVFEPTEQGIKVTETFDPESQNPPEMQRAGWQSILENFKKHVEG